MEIDNNQIEMAQIQTDSEEVSPKNDEKKPIKTTRKQRINNIVKRINQDSLDFVIEDVLAENKRLRRELENLRIQNTSLKREYEELTHTILSDRLSNQTSKYQLN